MSTKTEIGSRRNSQESVKRWKCPLCGKQFKTEVEKDTHMTMSCKPQGATEREQATGSVGNPKGVGLSRKQRVLLSWTKQVHTGEREIYFFNKSGDMFVLKLFLQNSSSSGKAKFECKCEMEVGEHEGSLNISDSGVYEVLPFSIQRAEGKQQPVVLKTVGTEAPKAGYNLARDQPVADSYSQAGTNKQASKDLDKYKKDIELLKKEHTAEKEDLLKREEKHKQAISLLKARVADKEKQLSFKDEKITTLEEEMGRFSEKSHEVFDKYTEDKSKFSEAEAQLAAVRKELEQQKHLVANLQRGKEELEDKNAILVKQQLQLESEITTLKYQLESLSGHTSLEINELQKKHRDTSAQPVGREEYINSLKSRIAELETELLRKQRSIEQLSQGTANSDYEGMRQKYCQIENELKQLKLKMSKRGATTSPDSFVSDTQTRAAASGTAARCSKLLQEEIEDIKMNLTLKTVECDDLKNTVSSLRKELKSAEDLLASKLDVASQFEATESERDVSGLSVSQSLGAEFMGRNLSYNNITQQPTGQAMWRQHSDTTDVDRIRQLEKQLSEKSTNLQTLKTFSEQKMTENNILRENLDITTRELDRTKLELIKLSDQSNPDIKHAYAGYPSITQTHDISVQGQPPKAAVIPVQHKYKLTKLFFDGNFSDCYTLNQAEKPEALIGELAFCKPLGGVKYVIGTIKCIFQGRYSEKTIAGIEFLGPHGDSNGEYKYERYFHAKHKHAIFLPVNEVYILYHYPTK